MDESHVPGSHDNELGRVFSDFSSQDSASGTTSPGGTTTKKNLSQVGGATKRTLNENGREIDIAITIGTCQY